MKCPRMLWFLVFLIVNLIHDISLARATNEVPSYKAPEGHQQNLIEIDINSNGAQQSTNRPTYTYGRCSCSKTPSDYSSCAGDVNSSIKKAINSALTTEKKKGEEARRAGKKAPANYLHKIFRVTSQDVEISLQQGAGGNDNQAASMETIKEVNITKEVAIIKVPVRPAPSPDNNERIIFAIDKDGTITECKIAKIPECKSANNSKCNPAEILKRKEAEIVQCLQGNNLGPLPNT